MPNTKSAARRMRNSERKRLHNRSIESRVRKLERNFRELVEAGKKDEASKSLRDVASALDKAVKSGVMHRASASRKRSRHTLALNRAK